MEYRSVARPGGVPDARQFLTFVRRQIEMFEYHGWATLRSDTRDGEVTAPDIEDLRRRLADLDGSGGAGLRFTNGSIHLWLTGNRNHRNDAVVNFYRQVGKAFPGSYGLLYIRDDESVHDNAFRVLRLVRGEVEERDDPFLSPCVPTIEDPFDPDRDG